MDDFDLPTMQAAFKASPHKEKIEETLIKSAKKRGG